MRCDFKSFGEKKSTSKSLENLHNSQNEILRCYSNIVLPPSSLRKGDEGAYNKSRDDP
jgi:hypothetical protein